MKTTHIIEIMFNENNIVVRRVTSDYYFDNIFGLSRVYRVHTYPRTPKRIAWLVSSGLWKYSRPESFYA